MNTAESILDVLDRAAEAYFFPMLDNGYVYLAATRMSLFRSDEDWALVLEVFGFSPRAGLPDLSVSTYSSRLRDRDPPEKFASRDAYDNYLAQHPNDEARFFYPVAEGPWQDPEDGELVASGAAQVEVRGSSVKLPSADELARFGISLSEPPRISVFELCRYLAATHRDAVLATPAERRLSVPNGLTEILCLDEWHHPDLAASELPSSTEAFQQLARVLATGNPAEYHSTAQPNTHWSNWPDGGTL